MRIIAGSKKGMKLFSPKGLDTRPITDRVKESIFSILFRYGMPADCAVADVFCGTGSFGLESLSRGASRAVFVELSREVVEILNRNIDKAGFADKSRVVRGNAFKAGAPVMPGEEKFDLVFFDPPFPMSYDTSMKSRMGKAMIVINEQVKEGGLVLVRTHRRAVLLENYGRLQVFDRREWGNMAETFLKLVPDQSESEKAQENSGNDSDG